MLERSGHSFEALVTISLIEHGENSSLMDYRHRLLFHFMIMFLPTNSMFPRVVLMFRWR